MTVSTKLISFTIPDSLKKVMRDKIKESRTKDIEVGFNLCTENKGNQLHDESHCTGIQCSVDIPKRCIRGKLETEYTRALGEEFEPENRM